jgi:hypothetical protein
MNSGLVRVQVAALAAVLLASAAPLAAAPGDAAPRGTGRVHLPVSELGGDYFELVTRFDSGHSLFASAVVHNFGVGDGHAKIVGYLMEPDGTLHRFARSEKQGLWTLSGEGGHMDLNRIQLSRARPERRLQVRKKQLEIDLRIPRAGSPTWPEEPVSLGCSLDLLETAAPVEGSVRTPDAAEPKSLTGRAALTQRWMESLEADCALRRLELFVLEPELGLYFTQVLAPDGATRTWWTATHGGTPLSLPSSPRFEANFVHDGDGYPRLLSLDVDGAPLRVHVEVDRPLPVIDPLPDIPLVLRALVAERTEPRVGFGPVPFRADVSAPDAPPVHYEGTALVKISYFRRLRD